MLLLKKKKKAKIVGLTQPSQGSEAQVTRCCQGNQNKTEAGCTCSMNHAVC